MAVDSADQQDTSDKAHKKMVAKFASMTLPERAAVAVELSEMCTKMALAGIRAQHGNLGEDEIRWHLAARRYGASLANQVYGPLNR